MIPEHVLDEDGFVRPPHLEPPKVVRPIAGGKVWGSLDVTRVPHAGYVLPTGSLYSGFQSVITGAGDTFAAATPTVDSNYLGTIDVLFVTALAGPSAGFSVDEQAAVTAWVNAGGVLISTPDHSGTIGADTITGMFGLDNHMTDFTTTQRPALSTHALVAGVTDFLFSNPMEFTVGADAVVLADDPGMNPLMAVLDGDTDFESIGCVLDAGDSSVLQDALIGEEENSVFAANLMTWVNDCPAKPAINEIRVDQATSDADEFIELRYIAGADLTGYTLLVIGDSDTAGDYGVIESAIDLTGQTVPGDAKFVIAESTFTLGTADMTATLDFEDADNLTFLIVQGFSGSDGADLDSDDDCVLDTTPWTAIADEVAVLDTTTGGDCVYSSVTVGPDPETATGHVYRCPDRRGDFVISDLALVGNDTPGDDNAPCLAIGAACAMDGECASGHCVDAVCCDASCGGGSTDDCQACDLAGSVGTCTVVTDTAQVCRAGSGDGCDPEETCDGTDAACPADVLATDGTPCGNGDTCDGGVCGDPGAGGMGGSPSGTGGTGGTGGSATNGAGGASAGGVNAGGSTGGGNPDPDDDTDGCGCTVVGHDQDTSGWWLLLGFAGLARRRRRP